MAGFFYLFHHETYSFFVFFLIFAAKRNTDHQNKNDMKHTITTLFLLLLLAVAGMAKAQSDPSDLDYIFNKARTL